MQLDPKGLEAARYQPGTNHDGIIRAYLTAIAPAEVGGLVERLDRLVDAQIDDNLEYIRAADEAMSEAASLIQSQAAELAKFDFEKHSLKVSLARAEAALAEARKALGMMLKEHDILSGNFGDVIDPKHKRPDRWPTAAEAARRALEGGE